MNFKKFRVYLRPVCIALIFVVQLGKMKVNLGDKMRVKVNGERVVIPYRRENQLSVTRNGDTVLLETYLGLKVLWDGNSFLEVSVPTVYKGEKFVL